MDLFGASLTTDAQNSTVCSLGNLGRQHGFVSASIFLQNNHGGKSKAM
jgi:hypothetical protein